jgi:hypothetical protein
MKSLTELQVKCLMDALRGNLVRAQVPDPFQGHDPNNDHLGQTVASLIKNGSLRAIKFNGYGTPLEVAAVKESDIMKAVLFIGKRVRHRYKGNIIPPLTVTGVAVEKRKVYIQFESGTNVFREFESLLPDAEAPGDQL